MKCDYCNKTLKNKRDPWGYYWECNDCNTGYLEVDRE